MSPPGTECPVVEDGSRRHTSQENLSELALGPCSTAQHTSSGTCRPMNQKSHQYFSKFGLRFLFLSVGSILSGINKETEGGEECGRQRSWKLNLIYCSFIYFQEIFLTILVSFS